MGSLHGRPSSSRRRSRNGSSRASWPSRCKGRRSHRSPPFGESRPGQRSTARGLAHARGRAPRREAGELLAVGVGDLRLTALHPDDHPTAAEPDLEPPVAVGGERTRCGQHGPGVVGERLTVGGGIGPPEQPPVLAAAGGAPLALRPDEDVGRGPPAVQRLSLAAFHFPSRRCGRPRSSSRRRTRRPDLAEKSRYSIGWSSVRTRGSRCRARSATPWGKPRTRARRRVVGSPSATGGVCLWTRSVVRSGLRLSLRDGLRRRCASRLRRTPPAARARLGRARPTSRRAPPSPSCRDVAACRTRDRESKNVQS